MPAVKSKPKQSPAAKLDLYKLHKADYAATRKPVILDIGPATYLSISGTGSPDDECFGDAIGGLYGIAFTLKFNFKKLGRDYGVCKLEGLWTGWDTSKPHDKQDKTGWKWTLLIRTPPFITDRDVKAAADQLIEKGKNPACRKVKLIELREGRCVQMLHVGPYADEMATIDRMHALASEKGLRVHGRHHEIYLCDPRRVAPERLRTILRHPVK